MKAAKERVGITYKEYDRHNFFNVSEEKQEEEYREILEKHRIREREKELGYINTVVENTGWTPEYAEEMMKHSKEATGASYEHYAIYRFWEVDEETQKTYFCKGDADKLREIYNKDPKILRQFINKDLFCEKFDKYLGRPWLSTDQLSWDVFQKRFEDQRKIIYKPRASSGGNNVQVFDLQLQSLKDAYEAIRRLPDGVIEGYIDQHPEMKRLSPNSVNTLRVVTIQTQDNIPGVEPNKVHFVYAGVRMGQGNSVVDNLHQGGMIAILDLETGKIETNAVDFKNCVFEKHPDTGTVIKGFRIPHFEKVKQLIETAGAGIPAYLGWDIAITPDGPIIVEINTHPGADGLQTAYLPEKKGVRHIIERFLSEPITDLQDPEIPYGTKISAITKEGIEFYWKKLERAHGYEIFRGYKEDGPFEKIAEITKRSIGTYIDSGFDHSKKSVFYTVRSYLKHGDVYTYSEMVDAKEAVFQDEIIMEREATYMYSGTTRTIRAVYGWGEVEDGKWSSSDETVATVSDDGVITAIASGECDIICRSDAIGQQAKSKVVVDRKACEPLEEITSRYHYNNETGYWSNAKQTNDAVIMMVGDMMCGKKQMTTQCNDREGWNFNDSFVYVREMTAKSDFAIGNLETLLASGWSYMSEECYIDNMNNCNATSRYLDAVKFGGFDAVTMANNHNCDGGKRALLETIEQVEKYRFARTGAFTDTSDKKFFIADVNGIKVGFLAYISEHTGFNGKDATWDPADKDVHLNIFNEEKAQKDIADCKAAGAEFVIVYMHWGYKNFRTVVQEQVDEAVIVAEAGADYIVGANPHVIQVYTTITTSDGRKVPCAYSIGNFQAVMNQVEGNRDSVILRIRLVKNERGIVELQENNYIPCHTYTKIEDSRWAPVAVGGTFRISAKKSKKKAYCEQICNAIGDEIKMY